MNGLYDAEIDGAPVVALTGLTFHDLIGARFMQGVDTIRLMESVALYNEQVTGPRARVIVAQPGLPRRARRPRRRPLADPQGRAGDEAVRGQASMEIHGARSSSAWSRRWSRRRRPVARRRRTCSTPARASRSWSGRARSAPGEEVEQLADRLARPVAKALLGKACCADDSPFTTGGIGASRHRAVIVGDAECDTLLILGSTMPWIDFYPKPGQARACRSTCCPSASACATRSRSG